MIESITFTLPDNFETVRSKLLVLIGEKENFMTTRSIKHILRNNNNCIGGVISHEGYGILYIMQYISIN